MNDLLIYILIGLSLLGNLLGIIFFVIYLIKLNRSKKELNNKIKEFELFIDFLRFLNKESGNYDQEKSEKIKSEKVL